MDPFITIAGLGLLAYGAQKYSRRMHRQRVLRHLAQANEDQRQRQHARQVAAQQEQARQQYARLNGLHGRMQAGLLQLQGAPDFQRAASLAQQAHEVPPQYRQQQFVRFRSSLVEHLARRLAAGEDEARLIQSLTDLVQALGMGQFESQYIADEARRRQVRPAGPVAAPYEDQLRRLQADHDQRLATLRSLSGLDDDLREQLIEAEQNRHRDALLATGNQPATP